MVFTASLVSLLQSRGLKISIVRLDPYLNTDAKFLDGAKEVYCLADGTEVDADLGHVERFTHLLLSSANTFSTGKIYSQVIAKERKGEYLGATVQVVPHITNEIKDRIMRAGATSNADITLVTLGGTVGDIESLPFLEAIRQMKNDVGKENVFYFHLSLVPWIKVSEELKTKPTQHSVSTLRGLGISPDALGLRSEKPLSKELKEKVSLFCDVEKGAIISLPDVSSIYEIPINLQNAKIDETICEVLSLPSKPSDTSEWSNLLQRLSILKQEVKIGIIAKDGPTSESHISLKEALLHAGIELDTRTNLHWLTESTELSSDSKENLDAMIMIGELTDHGPKSIQRIRQCREEKIPYLGIDGGFQAAIIEFGYSCVELSDSNSTQLDRNTPHPVIDLPIEMKENNNHSKDGRNGLFPCNTLSHTKAREIYQEKTIYERHRHRYEFNNTYREDFEKAGMIFSGEYPPQKLVEILELPDRPFFMATQFHPEFQSYPNKPHPIFIEFIKSALEHKTSASISTKSKVSSRS
jgi:CTP synthase